MTKIEFFLKRHLKKPAFKLFCALGRVLSPFMDTGIEKETVRRILMFQGGGIGDVIRVLPLLKPLRDEFPHASLSVLSPFDSDFFNLYPHKDIISETIPIDITGAHRSIAGKLALARELRRRSFDLIVCPQTGLGLIEFSILSFLIGAPYRIGYDMKGAGFLYTTKLELREDLSIYAQNVDLLRAAGVTSDIDSAYFTLPREDVIFAESFLRHHGVAADDLLLSIAPFVIADKESPSPQHTTSPANSRTWPEHNYMDLIITTVRSFGAKVVVLGSNSPRSRFSEFLASSPSPHIISAIGKTTVRQAAAVINSSHLFIGNDSGLLHIAIALGIPCVGIFGSTSPAQVILTAHHSCVPIWKGLACSPCFVHQPIPDFECPYDIRCLKAISVEDVMSAAASLLKPSHPRLSAYEAPLQRE